MQYCKNSTQNSTSKDSTQNSTQKYSTQDSTQSYYKRQYSHNSTKLSIHVDVNKSVTKS